MSDENKESGVISSAENVVEDTSPETTDKENEVLTQDSPEKDSGLDEENPDNSEKLQADKEKRVGGFQRKIQKLQRENDALSHRLAQLELNSSPDFDRLARKNEEPVISDFDSYDQYISALSRYSAQRAASEAIQQIEIKKSQETIKNNFLKQVEEAQKKYKNFHEAIEDFDFSELNPAAQEVIINSPYGAELAYKIATDHKIGGDLLNLDELNSVRRIAKIEAIIELEKEGLAHKQNKNLSKAPPPPSQISGKFLAERSILDPSLDLDAYRELRERGFK